MTPILLNYTGILNATTSQTCNCYDMAAFLQYQVQFSVGIFVYFDYINPFGYLKKTDLIGWGPCNNPFFQGNKNNQIVSETSTSRTAFGNHAFIYLSSYGVVADACAGPHSGNESKQQYLTNAVDTTTPSPPSVPQGTEGNIIDYRGVISITSSLKTSSVMHESNKLDFIESVNFNSSTLKNEMLFFTKTIDIRECPQIGMDWVISQDEIHSDFPIVIRHVLLNDADSKSVDLKIYVSSNSIEPAQNQYLSLGSNHQMSSPIFEEGPKQLGESSGKFEAADYTRYIWLFRNMVFDLKAMNLTIENVQKISSWIYENTLQNTQQLEEAISPLINEVSVSKNKIKVDELITIDIDCSSDLKVFIEGEHPGLYIQSENDNSFSFIAKQTSINDFQVSVVNPISLFSTKKETTIKVE